MMVSDSVKRKRGRPATNSPPPVPSSRKTRWKANNKTPEVESRSSSRKRGRPSTYNNADSEDSDAKRRRESTPTIENENDSDYDQDGEQKIDKNGRLLGGKNRLFSPGKCYSSQSFFFMYRP